MTDELDPLRSAVAEMERRRQKLDDAIKAVKAVIDAPSQGLRDAALVMSDHVAPLRPSKRAPRKGETRDAIIGAMRSGREHSPKEISAAIGKGPNAVSAAMLRMVRDGLLVTSGYGRY